MTQVQAQAVPSASAQTIHAYYRPEKCELRPYLVLHGEKPAEPGCAYLVTVTLSKNSVHLPLVFPRSLKSRFFSAPKRRFGGARAYEEGCLRGALSFGAELTHPPVNEEPRCREVAGFFCFRQQPQGFTSRPTPAATAVRAPGIVARAPPARSGAVPGRELSDSLWPDPLPVNNPVGRQPREQPIPKPTR